MAWIPALVNWVGIFRWARRGAQARPRTSRSHRAYFPYGAPEDVDLAPTSEDGYAAVMAFVALKRTDRRP